MCVTYELRDHKSHVRLTISHTTFSISTQFAKYVTANLSRRTKHMYYNISEVCNRVSKTRAVA